MAKVTTSSRKEVGFYAYVLGGILDLQWDVETMTNPLLKKVVSDFLQYLYGENEWQKLKVLDGIRDKTRNQIKDEARIDLPSLFQGKAAWPLALPKETPNAKFDIEFIYAVKKLVEEIREGDSAMEQSDNAQPNPQTINKVPRILLPAGVTVDQLTIQNFREVTGHRFRVTTEQQNRINAKTLTREQAFAEFIAELKESA